MDNIKTIQDAESTFLANYNSEDYEKMSVAIDLLVATIEDNKIKVLMIQRSEHPYKDCWALPGVFLKIDETLEDAVKRGIKEETGISDVYFEQLYSFGDLNRDPRLRVISVTYMALIQKDKLEYKLGERARNIRLVDVDDILYGSNYRIAFDHKNIVEYARWRLKNKVEYTDIVFHFVPDLFTYPELQKAYEILLGESVYRTSFQRKMDPKVEETDQFVSGNGQRQSRLYRKKGEHKKEDGSVLIVVDAQNDFINGVLGSKDAEKIVPSIVDKINNHKGRIIVTMDTHDENYLDTMEGRKLPIKHCINETEGWELNKEIEAALKDRDVTVVNKSTFGSLKLDTVIRDSVASCNKIELVGYDLDICVVSNAMILKAQFPEVPIIVDTSCCAATSKEAFDAAKVVLKSCQININE